MYKIGLIGENLKYSFSKKYFDEKFKKECLHDFSYELYEINSIENFKNLLHIKNLIGLNITSPYKQSIIKYINKLDHISQKIKAVNTIFIDKVTSKIIGYNTDVYGFRKSLEMFLPKSKIIHCTRNSKDTCLSIYKNYFVSSQLKYAYNLKELGDFYKLYISIMKHWQKTLPEFIYNVKYENIVNNPNKEIKKLIKACDLNWNESCLKFYKNERVVKTASDTQVRNKLYKTSLNSWKNYKIFLKKFYEGLPS